MEDKKNNCLLCGGNLVYCDTPQKVECGLCHRIFESRAICENGHYICDECHSKNGIALILELCRHSKSRNPITIMKRLVAQPSIHMHGPEHHVLVGAALLTAYRNSGGNISLDTALKEMERRGKQVPGGACGFWGSCGAAVSTGMFLSIVTGATPLKKEEWGMANLMTSAALQSIGGLGGPRCCKRNSFTAIQEAVKFVRERLGIEMELPEEITCGFSSLNAQCKREECPYYPGGDKTAQKPRSSSKAEEGILRGQRSQ